jgi:L-ascorbate 6-phosphate lactonase
MEKLMNPLAQEIAAAEVPPASVRLWWLGQAGFAFKTHSGRIVFADPYLSDAVERLHGFKRLSLAPLAAEDVRADIVVLTHEHTDHLDPDALPVVARNNPQCRFAGPSGCREGLRQAGVAPGHFVLLQPDARHDLGEVVIHAAPADHGDYSPSALALVLDFGGVRVMLSGDTSLRTEALRPLLNLRPDVLLPCINGGFGNMNHIDAARLVELARPRYAIPCHFWTFAEQGGGDPLGFIHACKAFCPEVGALLLKPGEPFTVRNADGGREVELPCNKKP